MPTEMSNQTVVVVTGVGRGVGKSLALAYLARPNHTVVGSIRDDAAAGVTELEASPKGKGSQLLLVKIESACPADATKAVKDIQAMGVNHIDVLIANAGVSPPIEPIETVDIDTLTGTFRVNAVGPLALYQTSYELLKKSTNAKFIPISSAAGTLGGMERGKSFVAPAYCISKAALNWITLAAHCSNEWLTSVALNPGLVDTDMGSKTAEYLGLERAPWSPEESAEKIIAIIDQASREKYSGKFVDAITGNELPW